MPSQFTRAQTHRQHRREYRARSSIMARRTLPHIARSATIWRYTATKKARKMGPNYPYPDDSTIDVPRLQPAERFNSSYPTPCDTAHLLECSAPISCSTKFWRMSDGSALPPVESQGNRIFAAPCGWCHQERGLRISNPAWSASEYGIISQNRISTFEDAIAPSGE